MLYILKSILCLGILWTVYHFWLSKEQLFKFNRFYLLASIVFSLVAPSIVFETVTYVDPQPVVEIPDWSSVEIVESIDPIIVKKEVFDWQLTLYSLYWTIALILAIRFCVGVITLLHSTRKNPIKKWNNASLILLLKPLVPHTFLNYIFINKAEYEQDKINEELLLHEYEHVKQKHSYDILF
ncbi:hypothetical protein GWK10_16850, partial [Spongiivirga citrea]|nr:hypothetical protein [Spongiivirga citrea]